MTVASTRGFVEYRKLVQRIREEFEGLPELRVTVHEAARFWGLEEGTCELVLVSLAAAGFLAQGPDRRFEMYHQV